MVLNHLQAIRVPNKLLGQCREALQRPPPEPIESQLVMLIQTVGHTTSPNKTEILDVGLWNQLVQRTKKYTGNHEALGTSDKSGTSDDSSVTSIGQITGEELCTGVANAAVVSCDADIEEPCNQQDSSETRKLVERITGGMWNREPANRHVYQSLHEVGDFKLGRKITSGKNAAELTDDSTMASPSWCCHGLLRRAAKTNLGCLASMLCGEDRRRSRHSRTLVTEQRDSSLDYFQKRQESFASAVSVTESEFCLDRSSTQRRMPSI